MTLDLKLTSAQDLALEDGNAVLVDGASRVRQQIGVTLRTWLGEYFLDTGFGVPYLESILVKSPNRAEIETVLRARINDVPGVSQVTAMSVDIDRQARSVSVNFTASTGEGLVSDVIILSE